MQKCNVLFVCTANMCRSPMAEGVLKFLTIKEGLSHISVTSSGIAAQEGFPATEKAMAITMEMGIDLSLHGSKPLTKELIEWADYILVMESKHKEEILYRFPETKDKVNLLKKFYPAYPEETEIADPIGKSIYHYRLCLNEIRESIEGFLEFLRKKLP